MLPRIILCMTCLSVGVFGAFALRNADSTVPAEGIGPANAVNEVTTTVANRSEAKEIVDATIESSFIELVPRNANLLVVCRPHEYLTSELGMLSTDWLFKGDSSFEREVKNIELLMFASTEKSAKNLANYRSQHAFETIVAKLNESQQQKARANRVTPTRINILNKDCTALVRFRNPVQWKYFEDWFHNDEEFQGDFSVEEINGVEVLGCSADNTCVVCKIEENTFVVGNRKQLLKGLESKQATNTKVAQWLEQNVDGELFAAVKEAGLDDNTLIFFTSYNGCSPEANFSVLKEHDHHPSAGYRGHKADIYEGGHRVPFIARWPKGIQGGQKTNAVACLTDLYATLRDITDQPTEDLGGEDSFSLAPAFKGESTTDRTTLVSHSIGGSFSIRKGDWKLCLSGGSGGWSSPREPEAKKKNLPPMQLFNLKDDRGERKNLVSDNPDKVNELLKQLAHEVQQGRCTTGNKVPNDRAVTFLPDGVKMPESGTSPVSCRRLAC